MKHVKQLEELTYLGSVITSDGKYMLDIEKRRASATRVFGTLRQRIWGKREKCMYVKLKFFNAFVIPVQLYDATVWAPTRAEEKRLDAFEVGNLCSILGVR